MKIDKVKLLSIFKTIQIDDSINLGDSTILKDLTIKNQTINLDILISNPSLQFKNKLRDEIKNKVLNIFPHSTINTNFIIKKPTKNIIAIASGKGGVGKSTISSNLAISLKEEGYRVGLIDADIYGPSIPLMFDAEQEKPKIIRKNNLSLMSPIISYGIKIMSIGFFSNPSEAIVWRGPMATKALKQIITQTDWGELDYLLIDLPPGTGDIHLSLVQTIALTGDIIVTTPQPVSLVDAKKAINMFKMKNINVPIIGLVENMSWLLIENKKHYIFGRDGGKNLSQAENIPLLVELPLDQSIREAGDVGRPAALQNSLLSNVFSNLAREVQNQICERKKDLPPTKKVKITHNRGCN